MNSKLIAAIDVGSHALRMKIGEIKKDGSFKELEKFRKTVVLGHDTFTTHKLSLDSVEKTCNILKGFKGILNDYQIDSYKALATSAIREAQNRDYILDQIKIKTGIEIEVISNSQEQYLTHKAIKYKLNNYKEIIREGAVIVVIGAGSIQITTYKDGKLRFSQNVKMGALRIKEVLRSFEDKALNYHVLLDEYIDANLDGIDFLKQEIEYKHFIAVGGEIEVIGKMIAMSKNESNSEIITTKDFEQLFESLLNKTVNEIIEEYDIIRERAEIIIPAMMLFKKFIKKAKAKEIEVPNISLTDGIIREIYEDIHKLKNEDETVEDIIANSEFLAKKFQYDENHCKAVEEFSLFFFDKLKKIHGLEEERTLLRIAAILHDIGKFISLEKHSIHSYTIIKRLEIFGLSKNQMEIIANIAKYHSVNVPNKEDIEFSSLSEKNRILIAKLVAIIRLADALDRSHKQKIQIQSIKVKDKILTIKALSKTNTDIEEWTFLKKAVFFEEVFGITPVLKIKIDL